MPDERWISVSDNHGNHADPAACGVMFAFLKQWNPTVRIHIGDCFNFAALRKNASDFEKREKMSDDVDAGISFLDKFKPTHIAWGNHDQRLWDILETDDGPAIDHANSIISKIEEVTHKAKCVPYCKRKGVIQYGDHRFIHGYHSGIYAASHAALAYGNVIMGHVHTTLAASVPRFEGATGYAQGALCKLEQKYNRAHANTLRQNHGFSYGIKTESGKLIVYQARQVDGRWFFPTEIRELKCELRQANSTARRRKTA